MRKHIRPAHPDATIPDPARRCDLPPDGLPCEWSVHWARLEARGDVIVTDIEPEAVNEAAAGEAKPQAQLPAPVSHLPADPAPAPEPGTVASVPFMITTEMRERLRTAGFSDDEIAEMTPAKAHELLAEHPDAPSA